MMKAKEGDLICVDAAQQLLLATASHTKAPKASGLFDIRCWYVAYLCACVCVL